jgi:hypothetical protein
MRFRAAATLLVLLALGCDAGLKPEPTSAYCPAGICGVVHFHGVVPDSTDYVRVVVYASVPRTLTELTTFAGFSDALPLHADSAFYNCCITRLPPGAYGWVLVVWKKVGALDATTAPALLREIGSYLDPADSTRFGTVVVPDGGGARGITIAADYSRMHSISDYFPPASGSGRP